MADLFDRRDTASTPLGKYAQDFNEFCMFAKLEGPIGPRMIFKGKEMLTWSLNDYLGLANHPEVRKTDEEAAKEWGLAYPMGARMLTGNTDEHEILEQELAAFVNKEAAYLVNYGYQAVLSIIDALVDRNDVIVYDAESHGCIVDGVRLHVGKRFVYNHNDMQSFEQQLIRATRIIKKTGGGILVVTEGVFGMRGALGKLKEILAFKSKYSFRLLIDDAHGFGVLGKRGAGIMELLDIENEVDLYFSTFAKGMACVGGFVAGKKEIIQYLKYNMRSQIFAKSLPLAIVLGIRKRLSLIQAHPEYKEKLWTIVDAIQDGFRKNGFNIGNTEAPVTPVYLKGGSVYEAYNLILDLRAHHRIFCSGIMFPVVPRGVILLRIIPTAAHSLQDVEETISSFVKVKDKLDRKFYVSMNPEISEISISS